MWNKIDTRALNKWLKANLPFHARAARESCISVVICAETGRDLSGYADAIKAAFPIVARAEQPGQKNYMSLFQRRES